MKKVLSSLQVISNKIQPSLQILNCYENELRTIAHYLNFFYLPENVYHNLIPIVLIKFIELNTL